MIIMTIGKHHRRAIIAVINLKGGTGKTTSAVFLAHALHEQGRKVLLVDADPQASAQSWNEDAPEPFPFGVIGLPTKDLAGQLQDYVGQDVNAIVIDTPPLEQKSGIVVSALKIATLAVVPVAPTPIEYKRLGQVAEVAADVAGLRPDGKPVPMAVLLTRTVPNASSTEAYRQQIRDDGLWCLRTEVRRLELFAQADGDNVDGASATAYGDAIAEMFEREVVA
jgi:chromosome partitioning protein